MSRVVCFAFVLFCASQAQIPPPPHPHYEDCGSPGATVKLIEVEPCFRPNISCMLQQFSQAVVRIDFVSKINTPMMKTVVTGIMKDKKTVDFPPDDPDACHTGVKCPVRVGDEMKAYMVKMYVDPMAPTGVNMTVKWELKDAAMKNVICFMVPIIIKEG